jgi:hypothetical protein
MSSPLKMEVDAGRTINWACKQAVELANSKGCSIEFDFNDKTIIVKPGDDPAVHWKAYLDDCQRAHEAWINSDEYKQQQAEAKRKAEEKQRLLDEALALAPANMTLGCVPEDWAKAKEANKDPYSTAILAYAERWARLMEVRMDKGEKLADIADETSHLADNEGITGNMYGMAVFMLTKAWKHGEALRLWHNLKTQIGKEGEQANESGGVLNPAMLTLGEK